jgi:hypothetical protein
MKNLIKAASMMTTDSCPTMRPCVKDSLRRRGASSQPAFSFRKAVGTYVGTSEAIVLTQHVQPDPCRRLLLWSLRILVFRF